MPRIDPGYVAFLAHDEVEPDIEPSELGYVWTTPDGECHELVVPFGRVHVTRRKWENVPHNQ